jgi:Ca2+-transporting ATPase
MASDNLLVRVFGSCETMADASVVCTDKTGILTQNVMTVVAGSVGVHCKFVRGLKENPTRTNANDIPDDFSIDQAQLALSPPLRTLFNEAIVINSTAFEDMDSERGETLFVGSKMETALLKFAQELGWPDFRKTREDANIIQMIPFSSEHKNTGVVVHTKGGKGFRVYFKGASEILSKRCTRHIVVTKPEAELHEEALEVEEGDGVVKTKEIDALAEGNINQTINFYANQTLRTIALCYRDFDSWPPKEMERNGESEVSHSTVLSSGLSLLMLARCPTTILHKILR